MITRHTRVNRETTFAGIVVFMLIFAAISAWLWPYSVNSWLAFFGKDPAMVWWQGMLMGLVPGVGQFCIPVAAVTWILMLFLV